VRESVLVFRLKIEKTTEKGRIEPISKKKKCEVNEVLREISLTLYNSLKKFNFILRY